MKPLKTVKGTHLSFAESCLSVKNLNAFARKHPKLIFAMRVSFFHTVLLIASMQLLQAKPASGQGLEDINVSVGMNNEDITVLFAEIQSQTGLLFAFQQDHVDYAGKISFSKETRSVKATLELAFKGTALKFKQINNSVIVFGSKADEQPVNVRASITGTVKDKNGTPIPGVSVFIKGTSTGTTTDENGRYTIETTEALSGDEVLVFSFIGYKTTEEVVGARILIDLTLEEDTKMLDEVVINGGYYETTDKLKTGSIVKVTAKEIENQPVTSPLLSLQGRMAGVDVTPSSGAPGSAPVIRIRGLNSLRNLVGGNASYDGNFPLYVIDGVPVSSEMIQQEAGDVYLSKMGYDPLSTLNPANIESITVLKDGDATSIYGSRGANGVILITTKRNTKNTDRTNINLSTYMGGGQISKRVDLLNTQQYVKMRKEGLTNAGSTIIPSNYYDLIHWDTTRYTDWQKELLGGTANIYDIQAGVSSGSKNTTFDFGGGYHKETLIYGNDFGYQRISGSVGINHRSANQKFSLSVTANYGVERSKFFSGDFVHAALTLAPNAPQLYDDSGNLNWEIHELDGTLRNTWTNPMSWLLITSEKNTRNLISNARIGYELFEGFTLSTSLGMSDLVSSENRKTPLSSYSPTQRQQSTARAGFLDVQRNTWIIEPKISYSRKIGEHNLEAIAGATWQSSMQSMFIANGSGYSSDAFLGSLSGAQVIDRIYDDLSNYKYNSLYGRVGYNLSQKYLVNLTMRRDGSSRFGPDKRFGNFWSIGTGWIFSSEDFIKNTFPFISFGKLRASYGVTGSDNVGDYGFYNLYKLLNGSYEGVKGYAPDALFNPDYSWELTKKIEASLEVSFFENRVSAEVNWYRNRSSNQLVNYLLPATTGFEFVRENFEAIVQNTGWEFVLRGDMLQSNDWRWNISGNLTLPDNKLVEFDGIEDSPYATIYKIGEPLTIQWLYKSKGVNPETGVYEIEDRNNDGIINDSDRVLINLQGRKVYGGLSNTFQYKGLEINFLFQFVFQKQTRMLDYYTTPGITISNQPVSVLGRWQHTADNTDIQKYWSIGTSAGSDPHVAFIQTNQSDFNITDGSFLRLKTLSVGWLFPNTWIDRVRLQQGKIFLQGQNLFTLTKYKGLDPETGMSMPPLRVITAGIQLKF